MKCGTRPHCELCEKERERQVYFRTHVPLLSQTVKIIEQLSEALNESLLVTLSA